MSLHRLATRDGRVRVEVCAYGLTIHRIEVQREQHTFDVLAVSYTHLRAHETDS